VIESNIKNVTIIERLGGGNFGDVYRGLWQGVTPVALKHLKNIEQVKELMREVSILK
jgi:hypothetical protein